MPQLTHVVAHRRSTSCALPTLAKLTAGDEAHTQMADGSLNKRTRKYYLNWALLARMLQATRHTTCTRAASRASRQPTSSPRPCARPTSLPSTPPLPQPSHPPPRPPLPLAETAFLRFCWSLMGKEAVARSRKASVRSRMGERSLSQLTCSRGAYSERGEQARHAYAYKYASHALASARRRFMLSCKE